MPKFVLKEIDKKKSIGQVAKDLAIQTHVIRFWETKFDQIKPIIGKGDRRYYFKKDIDILKKIKHHLYEEGYTIVGLQKKLSSKNTIIKNRNSCHTQIQAQHKQITANDISGNISDSRKREIEGIIKNIELKLQKFQDLIQ